jgi:hypothetical protein
VAVREYVYIDELAERTPWTVEAIETMVRRGALQRGVHYFQPNGLRGRLIFKWSAIVAWIERAGRDVAMLQCEPAPTAAPNGSAGSDVEKATKALHRLLD